MNVGIGSAWPGTTLDVNGTVRMGGLTLSGNGAGNGNVLVGNSVGVGTWMPVSTLGAAGGTNYWNYSAAGNIGVSTIQAVGIGTSFVGGTGEAALSVMNGNVGIGTWVPLDILQVGRYKSSSGGFEVDSNGNVGIGTLFTSQSAFSVLSGNVGIGTWVPSQQFEVGEQNFDVTSFGNVGIQNSGPTVALEVGSPNSFSGAPYQIFAASWSNGAQSYPQYLGNWNSPGIWGIGPATTSTTDETLLIGAIDDPGTGMIWANDINLNLVIPGNIGIGVKTSAGMNEALYVNGNVGIGTVTATGGNLIVKGGGNVGIGTTWPGTAMDVNGTVRMTGLTLTGNGAGNGNVLVGNSVGVGTWMPVSTLGATGGTNYWLLNGGTNVGINTTQAVGIGTSFVGGTGEATLSVMNGNVGIGTWVPNGALIVQGGNVGIGTATPRGILDVEGGTASAGVNGSNINIVSQNAGSGANVNAGNINLTLGNPQGPGFQGMVVISGNGNAVGAAPQLEIQSTYAGGGSWYLGSTDNGNAIGGGNFIINNIGGSNGSQFVINSSGNVGIGSTAPGQALDIKGTVRTIGLTLTGNGAGNGNVLVGNSVGVGTWMPVSTLGASGGTNYWNYSAAGNIGVSTIQAVGIGTTFVGGVGGAALSVMNGNVGIGTWMPVNLLDVANGNIGIGTAYGINVNGVTLFTVRHDITSIYIGNQAGVGAPTLNGNNTAMGLQAFDGSTGTQNAAFGEEALENNSGGNNVAVGFASLNAISAGASNTAVGSLALTNSTGSFNAALGDAAGQLTGGGASDSLYLGASTNPLNNNDTNEIVIGYQTTGNGSNTVTLGNSSIVTTLLRGNVGIGTVLPNGSLVVMGGNVGIGSLTPGKALDIQGTIRDLGEIVNGNIGIGSAAPGSVLDVNGTARVGGFTLTGNGAGNGNVLVGNSVGVGTWMPVSTLGAAGGTNYWLLNGGSNVGINTTQAVGIGTSFVGGAGEAALSVMNGKVGIGTWVPIVPLQIVGIGTQNISGGGLIVTNGNVGIGTTSPGYPLDVKAGSSSFLDQWVVHASSNVSAPAGAYIVMDGTSATDHQAGFAIANQGAGKWYIVNSTASNTTDDFGIYSSALNEDIFDISPSGNVGIGTTLSQGGLSVMNGNVGIGTWVPSSPLTVEGSMTSIVPSATASFIGLNYNPNEPAALVSIGNTASDTEVGFYVVPSFSNNGYQENNDLVLATDKNLNDSNEHDVALTVSPFQQLVSLTSESQNGNVVGYGFPILITTGNDTTAVAGLYIGNSSSQNIGIGTSNPQGGLTVMNGNVGIGTWVPALMLDVNGTARIKGFTLTGNGAGNGNVLVGNSVGVGTWMPVSTLGAASGTNYWLLNGGSNVGINTTQAVGIGTSFVGGTGEAALSVMNGNVGIGTWVPANLLDVENGNIGIGTAFNIMAGSSGNSILTLRTDTTSIYAGYRAGISTTAGGLNNTAYGSIALGDNTTGNGNTATGAASLPTNTMGNNNTADGWDALNQNISGSDNTATGVGALLFTTGSYNSGYGVAALYDNSAGSNNVALGYSAGYNYLGSNGFFVNNVQETSVANDEAYSLLYGTFSGTAGSLTGQQLVINGNVGIGSLSPGKALDVNGTARVGGFTLTGNGASNGNVLVGNSVGVGTWMPVSTLGAANGTNYWLLNGGSNVGINTTQAVGIGTTFVGGTGEATLSVMNGNVGIGTWVPGYTLETEGGSVGLGVNSNTSYLQIGQLANSQSVPNGLSLKDYITSTASNQSEAEVEAIARAASNTASTYFGIIGDVNNNLASAVNYTAATSLVGVAGYTTSSGSGTITGVASIFAGNSTYTGSGGGITNAYGVLVSDQTAATNNYGVYSGLSSGANKWNFYDNGPAPNYFNGNVGIGSTAPGQLLDVEGTVRTTGLTLSGNGAANGNVLVGNSVGVGTWMPASTLASTNYWNYSAAGNIGVSTVQAVGIGTTFIGGTGEAALSVMNGNVGIGTWAPRATLDVEGTLSTVTFAGNVGIGTLIASNLLTVNGNMVAYGNILTNATGSSPASPRLFGFSPGFAAGQAAQMQFGDTDNVIQNGNGDRMQLSAYWGIEIHGDYQAVEGGFAGGTATDPSLTIFGPGVANNNILNLVNKAGTQIYDVVGYTGNVGIGTLNPFGGGLIVLPVNSGNVGIGSLTPGQALDVNGTIRMTGLTLTGNGAASGNVMVTNGVGVGTWMPASTLATAAGTNYWNYSAAGNIGVSTIQAVGIGTSFIGGTGEAALSIMNGNVGIGTWVPRAQLDIEGTLSVVSFGGNVGIGTWITNSGLQLKESLAFYRTGTAASVSSAGQTIIGVTNTATAVTITLATADVAPGRIIIVKDESGGAATNNITVNTQGGQKIDNVSSVTISANYGVVRVYSDGNNWFTF
jgi:hypothetical protein